MATSNTGYAVVGAAAIALAAGLVVAVAIARERDKSGTESQSSWQASMRQDLVSDMLKHGSKKKIVRKFGGSKTHTPSLDYLRQTKARG